MMRYNKTCWAVVNNNYYERPKQNNESYMSIAGPIIFERKGDAQKFMMETIRERKKGKYWKDEYVRFFRIAKVKASINEI